MGREARLPVFGVDDPLDLDQASRTPEWSTLCDFLQAMPERDADGQVRVRWLRHRRCLDPALLQYRSVPVRARCPPG